MNTTKRSSTQDCAWRMNPYVKGAAILLLSSAVVSQAAPTVIVTTPGQTVNSTYVQVNGTVSGAAKPMWYEVIEPGTGHLVDYGAFAQNANRFFMARHLSAGANQVNVYAADSGNATSVASITLTVNVTQAPAVRPRPHPAEVWWGGLGNNVQLQQYPSQWQTVQKYADAYFLHTAAWGPENNGLLQNLVQQEAQYGTKFIAELGGDTGTDGGWAQWEFNAWGAGGGFVSDRYNNTGLILSEITHDFHPEWQNFATANPSWNEAQINNQIANEWIQVFNLDYSVYPHLKTATTHSPVWWHWQNYPSLNPNTDSGNFSANGRNYSVDYFALHQDFQQKTAAVAGHPHWSFYSDFPWYCRVWDEDAVTATGTTGTEGWTCRQKVLAYEQWLQNNGCRHTSVCNEDISTQAATDINGANANFYDKSLKCMYLDQREGHRPNQFLFESWYTYSGGSLPSKVTPEDATDSYTGIAKSAIKYLKGIKDVNGTLETLQLTTTTSGNTTTITLQNTGDFVCMPALEVFETGDAGIATVWRDSGNVDISGAIRSAEGWVYTPMLSPNQTVSISCAATVPGSNSGKQVRVEAFWNVQDPTGVIRATSSWNLGSSAAFPILSGHTYVVRARNSGKCAEVAGANTANGGNVQQFTIWNPAASCQRWTAYDLGGGYWKFINVNSSRCLEVSAFSTAPGGNIQQWDWVNNNAQQWSLANAGGGFWKVINRNSGMLLDVEGGPGAMGDGINISQYYDINGANQQWAFDEVSPIVNGAVYSITALNSGKVMDVQSPNTADGANIGQWDWNGANWQRWTAYELGGGWVRLVSVNSGKVIEVAGMSTALGGNVQQWAWLNNNGQQWRLQGLDLGNSYEVINRNSGLVLDVAGISTANGANIQQWSWWAGAGQEWRFDLR